MVTGDKYLAADNGKARLNRQDIILDRLVEHGKKFIEDREQDARHKCKDDIKTSVEFITWSFHGPDIFKNSFQEQILPVCYSYYVYPAYSCLHCNADSLLLTMQ